MSRHHEIIQTKFIFQMPPSESNVHQCGFPGGPTIKNPLQYRTCRFNPWVGKIPWGRAWQPTPVFLPGEPHGQKSLAGYSPWGCKELDMTEETQHSIHQCSTEIILSRPNVKACVLTAFPLIFKCIYTHSCSQGSQFESSV